MIAFFDTCSNMVCLVSLRVVCFSTLIYLVSDGALPSTRKLLKKFDQNFYMPDLLDFEYKTTPIRKLDWGGLIDILFAET